MSCDNCGQVNAGSNDGYNNSKCQKFTSCLGAVVH